MPLNDLADEEDLEELEEHESNGKQQSGFVVCFQVKKEWVI